MLGQAEQGCCLCRYSKQAKDWGWREFLTLTTLFDADAGFLVNDAVQFTAEVLVLKESYTLTPVRPGRCCFWGAHAHSTSPACVWLPVFLGRSTPASLVRVIGINVEVASAPSLAGPETVAASSASALSAAQQSLHPLADGCLVQGPEAPLLLTAKGGEVLPGPTPVMSITWHIDNLSAFKDILETRKLFSKCGDPLWAAACSACLLVPAQGCSLWQLHAYPKPGLFPPRAPSMWETHHRLRRYVNLEGSELRLGVYESSSTLCVYLESDALGATLEHNLWVKFRVALLSGRGGGAPEWKQSAICTKTWNNSVLQFPKVPPARANAPAGKPLCAPMAQVCQ